MTSSVRQHKREACSTWQRGGSVMPQVTWVAMIICILFFEMNLATALWTGLIVGIAYTMFARAMYRQQLAVLQREMAREHQQHLHPRSVAGSSPR